MQNEKDKGEMVSQTYLMLATPNQQNVPRFETFNKKSTRICPKFQHEPGHTLYCHKIQNIRNEFQDATPES